MYTSHFMVCCSQLLVDPVENTTSAIGIFDDLNASAFPLFIPKFSVFWVLSRETSDNENVGCRAKIYLDSELISEFPFNAGFQGKTRTRAILMLNGVAFERPGKVKIVCTIDAVGSVVSEEYLFELRAIPTVTQSSIHA